MTHLKIILINFISGTITPCSSNKTSDRQYSAFYSKVSTVIGATRHKRGGGRTKSTMVISSYNLRRSQVRKTGKFGLKANFSFSLTVSLQHRNTFLFARLPLSNPLPKKIFLGRKYIAETLAPFKPPPSKVTPMPSVSFPLKDFQLKCLMPFSSPTLLILVDANPLKYFTKIINYDSTLTTRVR